MNFSPASVGTRDQGPLARLVADITEQIVSGQYQAGEKLPTEAQMQAHWGASRSVVREAMKMLASQGLVSIEQGRGTFVKQSDTSALQRQIEWTLRRAGSAAEGDGGVPSISSEVWDHLLDVRSVLEYAAVERAAQHATEKDITAMQTAIERMRAYPNDADKHSEFDLDFHRAIAEATQNPLWPVLLNSFNDLLRRYFAFSYHGPENALGTADQHQQILDAIKAHDPQGAIEALRHHMGRSQEDLVEARRQENARKTRQ